jgi:uncharacterized protein GlcG (DUF336 family)
LSLFKYVYGRVGALWSTGIEARQPPLREGEGTKLGRGEGGLPIIVNDKVIGAIGVSGVTAQQDGQIAKAGVDALPKILGQ